MRHSKTMHVAKRSIRLALLTGVAASFANDAAMAQQAIPSPTASGPSDTQPSAGDLGPQGGEITVTASRITRDGYTAPTPTVVIGQEFV